MAFDSQIGGLWEQCPEAVHGEVVVQPCPGGVVAYEEAEVRVATLVTRSGAGDTPQGHGHRRTIGDGGVGSREGLEQGVSVGSDRLDDGSRGDLAGLQHHDVLGDEIGGHEARPVDAEGLRRTAPD